VKESRLIQVLQEKQARFFLTGRRKKSPSPTWYHNHDSSLLSK